MSELSNELEEETGNSSKSHMLTTYDNPYNPFTQYEEWFQFDMIKGYNTTNYLGRIVNIDANMTDKQIDNEIERAIDDIVKHCPLQNYRKVTKETKIIPILD